MDKRFTTTHWSLVQMAGESAHPESRDALSRLCEAYWAPVYAYVRVRGNDPETARDLTQGFFAELLEKKRVKAADPERGRFRSFLLAGVKNYMGHERARAQTEKRGGAVVTLRLDFDAAESLLGSQGIERHTPEVLFERRWAVSVLTQAMGRLEEEMKRAGKGDTFRVLKPSLAGETDVPYKKIAADLGVSVPAARVTMHRLRRRFGVLLREEVSETLADPALLDDELSFLSSALS
jgi:RNA polymerase sigma factor (sigma-70 family)